MLGITKNWVCVLAFIPGTLDQLLLMRNEYLVVENRILKAKLKTRVQLTDSDKFTLARVVHRLGREALEEVANAMKPDTFMD